MRTIGDVMARPVKTVPPGATIAEAAKLMKKNRIASLVVVDGERPVGIVTERDIAYKIMAEGKDPSTPVEDVMSKDLKTMGPERSLQDAAKLMAAHVIRHLPVVEGGKLVGIVTIEDILKSEKIGEDVRKYSFT
ncbi:MAG: CBS domain-containing protein [Euryarchaeota archaeon]|nr:CBS domain-containing protein [Euryarchaeota archaeon]